MIPNILSIAGSDPSGGAGIQADLKTCSALGAYGMAAITALTAQNTDGVSGVHEVPAAFVAKQVEDIFKDIRIDAIKIGMIGSAQTTEALRDLIQQRNPRNIVLDPVMVSQSGDQLITDDAKKALRHYLVPLAHVLTPNIPEAEVFLGRNFKQDFSSDMQYMATELLKLGPRSVLLKGGHLGGERSDDVYADKDSVKVLEQKRIDTKNTHGTGCTLSSALAVYLAKGLPPFEATEAAKKYLTEALAHADELDIGQNAGPVHHFWHIWRT